MEQNIQYGFCPKCGALMKQGVCQSCEYTINVYNSPDIEMYQDVQQSGVKYGIPQPQPEKKKNTGVIIGLVIAGVLFMMVIVVLLVMFIAIYTYLDTVNISDPVDRYQVKEEVDYPLMEEEDDSKINDSIEGTSIIEDEAWEDIWDEVEESNERIDLDGDGVGDLEFDLGVEGLQAEYYPVITDYIRYDLDYSISFETYKSENGRTECIYPQLDGSVADIDYLNDFFYNFMKETETIANDNECDATSTAYVTYMDEEIFSVVIIEVYEFSDGSTYEYVYCNNFDVVSGTRIYFELIDTSDEFLNELETRCIQESTSDANYLFEKYTKDEIRNDILTTDFGLVAFYTPLGMEIGLNYDGYWCCSTFKDYKKYIIEWVAENEATEF